LPRIGAIRDKVPTPNWRKEDLRNASTRTEAERSRRGDSDLSRDATWPRPAPRSRARAAGERAASLERGAVSAAGRSQHTHLPGADAGALALRVSRSWTRGSSPGAPE